MATKKVIPKKAMKKAAPSKGETKKPVKETLVPKKEIPDNEVSWVGKIPFIKAGRYADGLPYPDFNYLAFKLILKPNRFVSRDSMFDFGKVVKGAAIENGVGFTMSGFSERPIKIREVLFIDTKDFRLYNNSLILRRRVEYQDGFPVGDPEIVFKYRNPDLQKTVETDVRPNIQGDYEVKFKCQVLPLKDRLGGVRILYSSNVQFPRKNATHAGDVFGFDFISKVFPVLESMKKEEGERVEFVNGTIIEEVLQDICMLDFGDGVTCKANVSIWRTRGEHRPLIGEFAYQFKFTDRRELGVKPEVMKRVESFFLALQYSAKDWIALNATKTGVVYRLLGNPPKANE